MVLTFSNKAKSLLVKLLLLGGTAGGGGLLEADLTDTPLGGRAGGSPRPFSLEGGAGPFPLSLCGNTGEFVANCDAVTDFVFKVPVLLLVIDGCVFPLVTIGVPSELRRVLNLPSCISNWLL